MHIPNGMLNGSICPVTAAVSSVGIVLAAWRAFVARQRPSPLRFAAVTAFIFAGQMINFPINGGTSGHLLGGVLAAALLGVPFAVLSMALVVTVQCIVFADGGFAVLGANIFNMALIGAGLAGFFQAVIGKHVSRNSGPYAVGLGAVAWLSVMMAALACSLELAVASTIPFSRVVGAMLSTHAFIGIGEGLITVAVCFAFAHRKVMVSQKRSVAVPLLASGIVAFIISPFASGLPDGLEWVAAKYQFYHEASPTFVSPLSGYMVSSLNNEIFSTALAGIIGVLLVFSFSWVIAAALKQSCRFSMGTQ